MTEGEDQRAEEANVSGGLQGIQPEPLSSEEPIGGGNPGESAHEQLQRTNRRLTLAIAALAVLGLAAGAFFLGQYSQAGTIREGERLRAALSRDVAKQKSQIAADAALEADLRRVLNSESARADGAEQDAASAQASNTSLSGDLSRSQKLVGLYAAMSAVDADLTDAFNTTLRNIDGMLSSNLANDWDTAMDYARAADTSAAEAKKLQKKRDGILRQIETTRS